MLQFGQAPCPLPLQVAIAPEQHELTGPETDHTLQRVQTTISKPLLDDQDETAKEPMNFLQPLQRK